MSKESEIEPEKVVSDNSFAESYKNEANEYFKSIFLI